MTDSHTINIHALTELTDAFRSRERIISDLDATMAAKTDELSTLEQRLAAAAAYEQALAMHVTELEARLEALRAGHAPEERALQQRLTAMHTTIATTEEALRALQREHQMTLTEKAAMIRRQLGGDLSAGHVYTAEILRGAGIGGGS